MQVALASQVKHGVGQGVHDSPFLKVLLGQILIQYLLKRRDTVLLQLRQSLIDGASQVLQDEWHGRQRYPLG